MTYSHETSAPHATIEIGKDIRDLQLPISIGILNASVKVSPKNETVWQMLLDIGKKRAAQYTPDSIKEIPHIAAFRQLYKRIGKDPSRYRPSSEMLMRRVTRGLSLYNVNSVVDIMNLISIETALPLGLYDRSRISGNIIFRIGRTGEGFQGIRKGIVNVESLPVLADATGPFGDPSSDSERTMIRPETRDMLFVMFSCAGNADGVLEKTAKSAQSLYAQFASGTNFHFQAVEL